MRVNSTGGRFSSFCTPWRMWAQSAKHVVITYISMNMHIGIRSKVKLSKKNHIVPPIDFFKSFQQKSLLHSILKFKCCWNFYLTRYMDGSVILILVFVTFICNELRLLCHGKKFIGYRSAHYVQTDS